jgi:hypothetical protein
MPRSDGTVVVRGPGRHGRLWKSGLITLAAGSLLSVAGAVLAISEGAACFGGDHPSCSGSAGKPRDELFWLGFGLSVSGDAGVGVVGPSLMIAGAQRRPNVLLADSTAALGAPSAAG